MAHLLEFIQSAHIVQAVITGVVLAYLTATVVMNAVFKANTTTVNGWTIAMKCGQPGNALLLRAACAKILPAVNSVQEAAYWTAIRDGAGQRLTGQHAYSLHFPAGQLPPNAAFWSLTLTDAAGYMQGNPAGRHSLGSRSGLLPNADGSVDIRIQHTAPALCETNWLPAPQGSYKLMLRAYLPGPAILDGVYHLPPVTKVQ
jgi:hypothetical protein